MSSVALPATLPPSPSVTVGERHRGVVVQRRRVGPGAVVVVDQRAAAGGDRQARSPSAVALSTSAALASSSACVISRAPLSSAIAASVTAAVVGRIVHRRDVERGRRPRRCASPSVTCRRTTPRCRRCRRRVGPGAVAVVDQRAAAGGDRQARSPSAAALSTSAALARSCGLRDQPRAAVLGDRGKRHRTRWSARRSPA